MSSAQPSATPRGWWDWTGTAPFGPSRQEPTDQLCWSDLVKGDRVHHFDYGDGTVDAAGPLVLYITWDDPNERLTHHTAMMARYLTRLDGSRAESRQTGRCW